VTLVGRIGKDPEFYEFKPEQQTGTVTGKWQFSMVTKKSYKDPASNEWTESVTWHRISTTKDLKSIGQGSMVLVEGEIKTYKDTNDVQKTIIQASKVVSLQGKSAVSSEPPFQ
jgi:single-stranded DNA-binding protein